jgi:hypothetical protein
VTTTEGTTRTLEVLLARSGADESFKQLAEKLRSRGLRVVEEQSSPIGAHDTGAAIRQAVGRYDVVLLGVLKEDRHADPSEPYARILRDAQVIEGALGPGRVVLLVEETVEALPDTHFARIRFPSARADMVLDDVVNKITVATAKPAVAEKDPHVQVPVMSQVKSSELRVPWFLVLVVLLAAAIPLVVATCAGGDDDADLSLVRLDGLGGVVDRQVSASRSGVDVDAEQSAADRAATPAAPAATLGAGNELLPTSCVIDLSKGEVLVESVICDGPGGLIIEGWEGPWHNSLLAVAVAEGAVGRVRYESTDREQIDLVGDLVVLDPEAAAFGVQQVTVTFSAGGQHLHLFEAVDGSGRFATLTFTLDEPAGG